MSIFIDVISALWLGILTSISPCPLATNVAAVSYLSKRIAHVKVVVVSGFAYTAGRMAAYSAVGFIIVNSLMTVPSIAQFLQKYTNKALGPILIAVGLFLLDAFKMSFSGLTLSEKTQRRMAEAGITGSFALGFIFALSFCPISAGLFFGSLIPLALKNESGAILPFIYGCGTALPVLFFAGCIALGVRSLNKWFYRFSRIEFYTRKVTGIIFIGVGLYYTWIFIVRLYLQ